MSKKKTAKRLVKATVHSHNPNRDTNQSYHDPHSSTQSDKPKDGSPYVHQRDKLDWTLAIRERNDLTDKQKRFKDLILDKKTKIVFISGPAGTSKAQPLDAKILTPNGWVTMGEILPGMEVISASGKSTKVISIHPQGEKDIYKVTFSDGSSTECCLDHLWFTQTCNDRYARTRVSNAKRGTRTHSPRVGSVKSLKEIQKTLFTGENRPNHYIPLTKPIVFKEKDHIIHPYCLGALLGDGCFRANYPKLTNSDTELVEAFAKLLPSDLSLSKHAEIEYAVIIKDKKLTQANSFQKELLRLGLDNKKSAEKFIPTEYLFDSIENRIELLKGLMDTDGATSATFTSYSTTSLQLAENVKFIINSLGGTSTISRYKTKYEYLEEIKTGMDVFVVSVVLPEHINPFKISRKHNIYSPNKKYLPSRSIVDITLVGKKEAQCILVEDSTHLYLTDDCVVTHNTYLAIYCGLLLLNQRRMSHISFIRTIAESASKSLGSLPGEANDKMSPYLMPLMDKLEELLPSGDVKRLMNEDRVRGLPVNYLRGASMNAQYIVVEEAQNYNIKEMTTVLTRIGQYSKMIIIGDPSQSDINGSSSFLPLFDWFNQPSSQEEGIHCVSFTKDDIVRSGILKHITERIEQYQEQRSLKS